MEFDGAAGAGSDPGNRPGEGDGDEPGDCYGTQAMLAFVISWLFSAVALLIAGRVFAGVQLKGDLGDALWVSAIYAVLSFFLHWFFFTLLAIATLGLGFVFHLVTSLLSAAIVLKVTSAFSSRFDIKGFAPAIGTAIFLAVATEVARRTSSAL